MRLYRLGGIVAWFASAVADPTILSAQTTPELGEPPTAPKDASGLPRNNAKALASASFSVNTTNREEVRSFFNAIYPASDNVPINTTANTANCTPGTNSADFQSAVVRRINWYRAMAGVPATVTLDAGLSTSNQLAALMMSANTNLSHTPPPTWNCFTLGGSNAAYRSDIALGADGPDAVNSYLRDAGANNTAVGHRRWLLYPQTQIMGTGDIPVQANFMAANAIWVFDGHLNDPRPATRKNYIAWPPSGYVPRQVVFPRWSFAYTNADFSSATVSMTSNGVSISTAVEIVQNGYGENTLVWVPLGLNAADFNVAWPFNGSDTTYTVGISNVMFGLFRSNFNYTVTIFDPSVPGSGYFPPIVSGPAQPVVGVNNAYNFNSVSNATSYHWRFTQRLPFTFADGAEGGLTNWTTNTSATYSAVTASPVASGMRAFQLGHPYPGAAPQTMVLNFVINPLTNTVLQFKSRLEYATPIQVARVQVSTNLGSAWTDIYAQAGDGTSGESVFSTCSVSLSGFAGTPLQLRFNYDIGYGSYYSGADSITGWHLDDIAITNAEQLLVPVTNSIASTNFQFMPAQPGSYNLQACGVIFNDFPLDWGPVKQVVAVAGTGPLIQISKITLTNNQARVDFALQSGIANTYKLLFASHPAGPWSTDNVAVLGTNAPGSLRFTTTPSGSFRLYKIQTP